MNIALECNHCGGDAVHSRPDGTFDEDAAGRCVSCCYPGRVQIVDDEDDTPADAYWLCDDDEKARCAIPSCNECYGGDVATIPLSAVEAMDAPQTVAELRGLYDRALRDVVAASRVEAELRAEVERLTRENDEGWAQYSSALSEKDRLFDEAEKIRIERDEARAEATWTFNHYDAMMRERVGHARRQRDVAREEVARLKAAAIRDADRQATLVAALRRIANGHDYPPQVAAAALTEVGA